MTASIDPYADGVAEGRRQAIADIVLFLRDEASRCAEAASFRRSADAGIAAVALRARADAIEQWDHLTFPAALQARLICSERERAAMGAQMRLIRCALIHDDLDDAARLGTARKIAKESVRLIHDADVRAIVFHAAGTALPAGWSFDRPICPESGTCLVCGKPGVETSRGQFWMHAPCVRKIGNVVTAAQIRALEAHGGRATEEESHETR